MRFLLTTTWSIVLCFCFWDLSAQTTTNLSPSKDNSIYSDNTGNSNGVGRLYAGQTCGGGNRRALMQFDLSSIPNGAIINSVTLTLNVDNVSSSATVNTYNLHALTQTWGEGTSSGGGSGAAAVAPDATWNNAISGGTPTAWTTAGGDFGASLASLSFAANTGTFTFTSNATLVAAAQSWVDAPATNFGLILIGDESTNCSARRIGSKDQGTAPILAVTWTPPCIPTAATINPVACDSYTVPSGDTSYTMSGMYMDTLQNAGGCDSVITINLTVNNSSTSSISPTVCGSYTAPSGAVYSSTGMYMDTITNMSNCDSVITINLTVNNNSSSSISATVCDSFIAPSGMIYYATGMYMDTIANMSSCDSVITINLTVGEVYSTLNTTTCTGSYTVPSGDTTYMMAGTYMDTIPSTGGCDSIITINLTMDTATYDTISPTVCGSYTVPSGNATYTSSGTYMDTLSNMSGCDSVITINLTVTGVVTSTISPQSCTGSYTVPSGDTTYTMSGTYTDTLTSVLGCDSIITINLTVGLPTADTITVLSCTGSYTVPSGDTTYTMSGTYMDTIANMSGCDSVLTINLTVADPSFSYGAAQYCSSTASNTSPTISGTAGGTFSSTSGLSLNGSTGEITMGSSSAGTYMVNYSVSGCQDSVSVELGETLNITLGYNGSQCTGTNGTAPSVTGYTGTGTFTISPTGIGINANTGALNLGGSTTGTYTVNYTANDICSSTASTSVTVTSTPAASFSYDSVAYCQETLTNPLPSVSGGTSGYFKCYSGASVDSATGRINLNASSINYHPIHYITTGTCADTATVIVRIIDCFPPVSVAQLAEEGNYSLMPNPNNGNFAILNDKAAHQATIEVFDVVGKMVHQEQVLLEAEGVHHIRPIQQLSEGYYFVRIIDEQAQKTFKMQVVNR